MEMQNITGTETADLLAGVGHTYMSAIVEL